MYIAHKDEMGNVQTVKEHNDACAELCKSFAIPELKQLVYLIGAYHDYGKYRKSFQKRINDEKTKAEHAICGAVKIQEKYKGLVELIAMLCIAGHHTGIPDCGTKSDGIDAPTLRGRLSHCEQTGVLSDIDIDDIAQELPSVSVDDKSLCEFFRKDCNSKEDAIEKTAFLTRYCFSCLVDADTLDTIKAVGGDIQRSLVADFEKCLAKLKNKLSSFIAVTELQKARAVLQKQAFENISKDAHIYLLDMPTGSGKTLTGLYCALNRAIKQKKKRIIYVIPYNSIIDQTADEFESILGSDAQILRHQSSFTYDDADIEEDYRKIYKYSSENWDAQIIITTAVQFFESIYSNKRSKLRKLHNIQDSILVFDEVHTMPIKYLMPCLNGITFITSYLNSEAIFLTATMPNYEEKMKEYFSAKLDFYDLIHDKNEYSKFDKCRYENAGEITDIALVEKSKSFASSLIITNTRKAAREIYGLLTGKKYHLSTYMTAFDRKRIIDEVKAELSALYEEFDDLSKVPEERRITLVSTSLIEAGVDLDFESVFRELNGLDSILQAGGRCNREGKRKNAVVTVFKWKDTPIMNNELGAKVNITNGIITEFENIATAEAIETYYNRLYTALNSETRENVISKDCGKLELIPYRTYAEKFNLIDSFSISIVYAHEEALTLIEKLKAGFPNIRKLQKYCFTVNKTEFEELLSQGVVDDFGTGVFVLTNNSYYDNELGIQTEGKDIIF